MKTYAVLLFRTGKIPEKDVIINFFKSLYDREPNAEELESVKLDLSNENVIFLKNYNS